MILSTLALAATATLAALPSSASVLDIPAATADFVTSPAGDAGEFLLFDAVGVIYDGAVLIDASVDLALTFDTADPYGTAEASLDILDSAGLVLSGLLARIGFEEDLLDLVFTDLAGPGASAFGNGLRLQLFFIDPVGADPLASLTDGASYEIAALGEGPAPVPLPGTLPLLAGAIGIVALRRRGARVA